MRSFFAAILFVFLAGFASTLHGQTAAPNQKPDYVRPYAVPSKNVQNAEGLASKERPAFGWLIGKSETCYTLHTLRVAKKRGSDETHIVGERTCTPASQFDFKSAVQKTK